MTKRDAVLKAVQLDPQDKYFRWQLAALMGDGETVDVDGAELTRAVLRNGGEGTVELTILPDDTAQWQQLHAMMEDGEAAVIVGETPTRADVERRAASGSQGAGGGAAAGDGRRRKQ